MRSATRFVLTSAIGAVVWVISLSPTLAAVKGASSRPDFSGLWQVADSDYVRRPDVHAVESDYTPEAWANLQAYRKDWNREVDDPAKFCSPGGMPHTVLTRARDYVMELHQYPRELLLLHEYMDRVRVIHFGQQTVPEAVSPSNEGYSIGHFDGNALVIETTQLKARNVVGPMQRSEQAHITERWSLGRDARLGTVLEIDVTVTDPEVFRHPVKGRQRLKRAPAGTVRNEYACPDALWDDHVTAVLQQRAASAGVKQ